MRQRCISDFFSKSTMEHWSPSTMFAQASSNILFFYEHGLMWPAKILLSVLPVYVGIEPHGPHLDHYNEPYYDTSN